MPPDEPLEPASESTNFSHWRREHDLWEHDISRWQADHQYALIELEHIAQLIVNHGAALRRYAMDLEAHKQSLNAVVGAGPAARVSESILRGMTSSHSTCRETHDRIRQHHNNVMALLRALGLALRAPM